jgi:hypothetical protein
MAFNIPASCWQVWHWFWQSLLHLTCEQPSTASMPFPKLRNMKTGVIRRFSFVLSEVGLAQQKVRQPQCQRWDKGGQHQCRQPSKDNKYQRWP